MLLVAWPEGFKNGFTDDVYVVWENFLFHKKCSHCSTYVAHSVEVSHGGNSHCSFTLMAQRTEHDFLLWPLRGGALAAASSRSSCIAPLRLVLGQKSRQTVGNNDDASRQIRSGYRALLQVEASRACYYILTRSPLIRRNGVDFFLMGSVSFYKTNILKKHSCKTSPYDNVPSGPEILTCLWLTALLGGFL